MLKRIFKIIVVGDGAVGKTSLARRFTTGSFTEDYKMTIGVGFFVKQSTIQTFSGEEQITLQIWDTAGQERFSFILDTYFRGANGGLLVYDVTYKSSFDSLSNWLEQIVRNCEGIPIIMVGNKIDLEREVSFDEAQEFATEHEFDYVETSAKSGENVEDVFDILTKKIMGHLNL